MSRRGWSRAGRSIRSTRRAGSPPPPAGGRDARRLRRDAPGRRRRRGAAHRLLGVADRPCGAWARRLRATCSTGGAVCGRTDRRRRSRCRATSPGWDIARIARGQRGGAPGGYVLDGWGGVHPVGSARRLRPPGTGTAGTSRVTSRCCRAVTAATCSTVGAASTRSVGAAGDRRGLLVRLGHRARDRAEPRRPGRLRARRMGWCAPVRWCTAVADQQLRPDASTTPTW